MGQSTDSAKTTTKLLRRGHALATIARKGSSTSIPLEKSIYVKLAFNIRRSTFIRTEVDNIYSFCKRNLSRGRDEKTTQVFCA